MEYLKNLKTFDSMNFAGSMAARFAMFAAFVLSMLPVKAYELSEITNEDGSFNYCRETFEKITYKWTDDDGVEHISNMAEPATEYRQICAFMGAVYYDSNIPGLTQLYMEPNDPLYYEDGSTTELRTVDYPNNRVCKYNGETIPYGIPGPATKPTENTLTAILMEVNTDPKVWHDNNDLREVTSARIITSRKRISPEDSDNPGWIFNFDQPLGNFFLMTKGKARDGRDMPSFGMFELYSPVNTTPNSVADIPTDTHERLLAGEAYPILHDCGRITEFNHHFSVLTDNSQTKHQHNMCIFIPDKRLTYWKYQDFDKSHPLYDNMLICGDRDNTGGKNTRSRFCNYNPNYLPHLLSYQIGLSSQIVKCDGHQYYALLEWKSNYKEVTKTPYHEEFMVYRVDNDGNMTPLEADEFILANDPDIPEGLFPEGTEVAAEGKEALRYRDENDPRIIWSKADPVRVIVKEQQEESGKRVNYIVRGRPRIEDFSYTFSNTDYVLIPGFHDSFFIAVAANYHSDYTPGGSVNSYRNNIVLYAPDASEQPLLAQDMVPGRSFHLIRYANDDIDTRQCIAEMTVTSVADDDEAARKVYGYRIDYFDFDYAEDGTWTRRPSEHPSVEGTLFTDYVFSEDGTRDEVAELDMHVLNTERPQEGYIATFTDILEENVVDNQHADLYTYYIVYNPSHIISFEDIKNHDDHHDDTMMTSNRVKVPVVKSDIAVNYLTYSSEDVAADVNRDIPVSTVTSIDFSISSNPRVQQYILHESKDGGNLYTDIVTAEKSSTSSDYLVQWVDRETADDSAMIVEETGNADGTNVVKTVRLNVEDYDNFAVDGQTDYERLYALSIQAKPVGAKYVNTYGSYTARGPVIPTLEALGYDDVLLTEGEGANDPDVYDIGTTITFAYPENDDLAFVYSRPLYKIWRRIVPKGEKPEDYEQTLIYDDTNDEIGLDLDFTIQEDGSVEVWDQYVTGHFLKDYEAYYYVRQYSRVEDDNVAGDSRRAASGRKIRYSAESNSLSPSHRYIVTESTAIAPLSITNWGQILALDPVVDDTARLRYAAGSLEVPAGVAVDIVNTQGRVMMRIPAARDDRSVSLGRLAKGLYIASSNDVAPLKFTIR